MFKKSPKSRRKDELNHQINILPSLSSKCFICDKHTEGKSIPLVMGQTRYSKATYPSKIGELVGDDFMVIISMEDVLCGKCTNLLNHLDKLETDLKVVRRILTGNLASKYSINHKDLFAKFEKKCVYEKRMAVKCAPKVYRCELCEFSTTNENAVSVHAEECVKLPHSCSLCPKRFASIQDHAKHAVIVHKLTTSCQICSSLFISEEDVAEHMKSHPHCNVCKTAFADQTHVEEHCEKEHKPPEIKEKQDIVEACLEELTKDSEPFALSEETTEIKFHTCRVCALTFLKASLFNEHMKMHENLKDDSCPSESLPTNSVDVSRIEDDLENLFEKLHAETSDSTKSEKPSTNEVDSTLFLLNNPANIENQVTKTVVITNINGDVGSSNSKYRSKTLREKDQCCVCKVFVLKHKLKFHLGTHVEGGDCTCSVCGQLVSAKALLDHCRRHLPESTNSVMCRYCSLTFTTKRLWKSHEETHTDVFVFGCTNCDRRFVTEEEKSVHEDRVHRTDIIDPIRRHCGKKVDNLQALKCHGENFHCNECQRVFKTKTGLKHHTALHTGQFQFCCDFCGRGFMSRAVLEEHRRKHTKEERYVCDVCGRKFSFQSTYWIHRKWHENPYPYKCNCCGRLFRHTSLLAVHKRKHTGERPYKCPDCPSSFSVGTSLKRHLILHTGAYPYKCQHCNKAFTTKHKYSLHLAKVHGDHQLTNRKSESKDFKMAVHEPSEAQAVDSWDLMQGINLEQVLGESTQQTDSMVVDGTTLVESLASGGRLVEIVRDDSFRAVATVTVAGYSSDLDKTCFN